MTPRPPLGEEDALLAAEVALGLLDGGERASAQARADHDGAFATTVEDWREFVTNWMASGAVVEPPGRVWSRIEARLPFNDDLGPARGARSAGGGALRAWQAATAVATAAALVLGLVAAERRQPAAPVEVPAPPPARSPLVAILSGADSDTVVVVSVEPGSRRIVSAPARLAAGGRSAQLWVIPSGGQPISLGLITDRQARALDASREGAAALVAGATLAVSLEPSGGSPSGKPTGPIVVKGKLTHA